MRISQATLNRRRKRGLYQDDISPRRVHVTIAIPEWLYDGLVAIANSERPRYTVSRVAAEALEDYFSDGGGFFTKS